MNFHKMKATKFIALALVLVLMLVVSTGLIGSMHNAYAIAPAQTYATIEVSTGINIKVNGKYYKMTDVNGNEVFAFVYNGTTYVPIRALSKLFGIIPDWDQTTYTVKLTKTGNEMLSDSFDMRTSQKQTEKSTISAQKGVSITVNGSEFIPKNVNGSVVDVYIYQGTTYVPIRAISELYGVQIDWDQAGKSVLLGEVKDYSGYTELQQKLLTYADEIEAYIPLIQADKDYLYDVYYASWICNSVYNLWLADCPKTKVEKPKKTTQYVV